MRLMIIALSIATCFTLTAAHAQSAAQPPAAADAPFTFTLPPSQVIVKMSDASLRPDETGGGPNYFKLIRRDPQLIVSGWLEPAEQYKGLKSFWDAESRSPAYAGKLAPVRIEMTRHGPWEVVGYDVPLAGIGTSAHLRAERVLAGTWIDLHLSATSAQPPETLRAELLTALDGIAVVEK